MDLDRSVSMLAPERKVREPPCYGDIIYRCLCSNSICITLTLFSLAEMARMHQPPMTEEQAAGQAAVQATTQTGPPSKKKKGASKNAKVASANPGAIAGNIGNAPNATFGTSGTFGANAGVHAFDANASYDANAAYGAISAYDASAAYIANTAYGYGANNYTVDNPGNSTYDHNAAYDANDAYAANDTNHTDDANSLYDNIILLQTQVASLQETVDYYKGIAQTAPAIDPELTPIGELERQLAAEKKKSGFLQESVAKLQSHIAFLENELANRSLTKPQDTAPRSK